MSVLLTALLSSLCHLPYAGLEPLMVALAWREDSMGWHPPTPHVYTKVVSGCTSRGWADLERQQSRGAMERQTGYCVFPMEDRGRRVVVWGPCLLKPEEAQIYPVPPKFYRKWGLKTTLNYESINCNMISFSPYFQARRNFSCFHCVRHFHFFPFKFLTLKPVLSSQERRPCPPPGP